MCTRDHSDTSGHSPPLESSASPNLEESVTPSFMLTHKQSVLSSDDPTGKAPVIKLELSYFMPSQFLSG